MSNSALRMIFYNSDGQRLRPLWRLVLQMLIMFGILLVEALPLAIIYSRTTWRLVGMGYFITNTLVLFVAFTGSVVWARLCLDKQSFASLGLRMDRQPARHVLYGLLLALLMLGGTFMTMQRIGWVQITPIDLHGVNGQALLLLGIFSLVGLMEELLFRGYVMQTIRSGWGSFAGIWISSLIFGWFHIANPSTNWLNTLGIIAMGLLLAFAAIRTGRLWLSIGLHAGWDFFQVMQFGSPITGVTVASVLHVHTIGPALWAGTDTVPGLIFLPVLLVAAGMVWAFTR